MKVSESVAGRLRSIAWLGVVAIAPLGLRLLADEPAKDPPVPAAAVSETPAAIATVFTLAGEEKPITGLTIAAGKVSGESELTGLMLDDLRRIDFLPSKKLANVLPAEKLPLTERLAKGTLVELVGGGKLLAQRVTIKNDVCDIADSVLGPSLQIPLDRVRSIRFSAAAVAEEISRAQSQPDAEQDRLFLTLDGKVSSTPGLLEELSAEEVVFQLDGQSQHVLRDKLVAIVVAQPQGEEPPMLGKLLFKEGSTLTGTLKSLTSDAGEWELPGGAPVKFPLTEVATLQLRSSRLLLLSEQKPVEVVQRTLVVLEMPWQKDQSVEGNPLTMGGKVYAQGLGVHAYTALTFALDGSYNRFAATIGLDAETQGRGDCIFHVLADDREIFTKRMRGTDPPEVLQLDITRAKRLTLVVEPGEELDLADHANWCDARLLKLKP